MKKYTKPQKEEQKPVEKTKISKKFSKLRFKVQDYYSIQNIRIMTENRLRLIKYSLGKDEKKKPENWEKVIEAGITDSHIDSYNALVFIQVKNIEENIAKQIGEELKEYRIYNEWLSKVKGIGRVLAGGIISHIHNIENFLTISKLWKYCGYGTNEQGEADKKKKGELIHWNPEMKKLLWKVGESFVKIKGGYNTYYKEYRAFYDRRFPENSKMHNYNMAKRKTVKLFLSHLFEVWWKLTGKMPLKYHSTKPYIIEKENNHKDYISPYSMI